MLLGDQQREDSLLGKRLPQRASPGARLRAAPHLRGQLAVEQLADGCGELPLILGEPEPHGQLLGRPSTRSATRLRWISLVPA